jgi:ribonuclease H / adenosylcobalamin/alpha-ribazole phosphatase
MRVHLVRHGHHSEVGRVLSGRSEIALDASGVGQAAALAAMLAGKRHAAIHSSPRRRCRDTAAPIATATGLDVTVAEALDEIDFGAFGGRAFAELDRDPDWQRWNAERDTFRCPGGETMAEAVARALAFLDKLRGDTDPVLCVTHCDVIRGIVAQAIGLPFGRMFALPCDPGSLTILDLDERGPHLVALNVGPAHVVDQ